MLQLYPWHDFYNVICTIKHKLYIQIKPQGTPTSEKFWALFTADLLYQVSMKPLQLFWKYTRTYEESLTQCNDCFIRADASDKVYLFKQNLWTNSILLVGEQRKNNNIYQLYILIQSDSTINLTHLQRSTFYKKKKKKKKKDTPWEINSLTENKLN